MTNHCEKCGSLSTLLNRCTQCGASMTSRYRNKNGELQRKQIREVATSKVWVLVIVLQAIIGLGVVGLCFKFSIWKEDLHRVVTVVMMYLLPTVLQIGLRNFWPTRSGGVICLMFSVIALFFVYLDLSGKPFFPLSPFVVVACAVCTYAMFFLKTLYLNMKRE